MSIHRRWRRVLWPSCLCLISTSAARGLSSITSPAQSAPYQPPSWCANQLTQAPHRRLVLANLPTPIYRALHHPLTPWNVNLLIKRDDSTGGVELSGNKIRKLEFLLADALERGCDAVVTIGGEQSNHCRATAAAARMIGLEPHLILRSPRANEDLGLVGNLLMDRMVGSQIYTCTPGEYGRVGSHELVRRVCAHLAAAGRRPYGIPVGGSNGVGSWGYVNGVDELIQQLSDDTPVDHIVFACGSGGTAAGITLGVALALGTSPRRPRVHAIGVCDDEDYFYREVADIATQMGLVVAEESTAEDFVRQHLTVHQGKGLGYAQSTAQELEFIQTLAATTGIVLDPVYSGKALYNFVQHVSESSDQYRDKTILFWHTGGALGLFEKVDELQQDLVRQSPCQRLDVYGKGAGIDISTPTAAS